VQVSVALVQPHTVGRILPLSYPRADNHGLLGRLLKLCPASLVILLVASDFFRSPQKIGLYLLKWNTA
jgi:hypothetical protein